MKNLLKKSMLLGIGALSVTRDKAESLVRELEEKGEVSSREAKDFIDELVDKGEQERRTLNDMVGKELNRLRGVMGLVTREELRAFEARLQRIEAAMGVQAHNVNPAGNEQTGANGTAGANPATGGLDVQDFGSDTSV